MNEDAYRAYLLSMIPEPWEKGFLIAINQCNCSCHINADGSADVVGTDDPDLIYYMELYRSIGAHVRYYRDMQALADKRHVDVSPIIERMMRSYDAPGTYEGRRRSSQT